MAQTTYTQYSTGLLAGTVTESPLTKIDSYVAEAAIPFGRGVIQGTGARQGLLAAAAGVLLGVSVRDHKYPLEQTNDVAAGQGLAVLTKGVITGELAANATKNAAAFILVATGTDQGKFTPAAGVDNVNLRVGKFLQGGSDGDIVQIEVDL